MEDGLYCIGKMFTDIQMPIKMPLAIFLFKRIFLLFVIECVVEYNKFKIKDRYMVPSYVMADFLLVLMVYFWGEFDGGEFIYFQF
jgi:hypothetical protein